MYVKKRKIWAMLWINTHLIIIIIIIIIISYKSYCSYQYISFLEISEKIGKCPLVWSFTWAQAQSLPNPSPTPDLKSSPKFVQTLEQSFAWSLSKSLPTSFPKPLPNLFHDIARGFTRMQGFIRPVARVGSGDPARVLRLYTTITLDEVCSIYCWDICTTCRYRSMCYSTCAPGPTAPSVCSLLCPQPNCWRLNWRLTTDDWPCTVLYNAFYGYFVDAIGTVFWDCPVLRYPGKALILVAKLLLLP